ncbi:MAG: o-succinylbenzoate--CoA ligase [Desulfotignum sp.]|nr:o-succinylbenzoate--CoA ligase [Desulfotignum sp.]
MDINLGKLFTNRAFLSPDLEACVGKDYRYTFGEMNQRINRFASFLTETGIRPGERIAILAKNNEQVLTALFGAAKTGIITAVLNFRLAPPELTYILNDCKARLLIYDDAFCDTTSALKSGTPVEMFVSIGGTTDDRSFENILMDMDDAEQEPTGSGSDPAVLMYTSGTTGKPKGAVLTHDNCFWAAVGLVHSLDWGYKYRYLSVAPLFHIGGLAPIFANVHVGCSMIFMPDFDPAAAWEILEKERINFTMTVPAMLQYMAMVPGAEKRDLSQLRHLICGGAPVPKPLITAYGQKNIAVYQVYGATEYSGAITFWTYDMGMEKANSAGKVVFHGSVRITDPISGKACALGEVGEIWLAGPQVFKGYWQNPEASQKALVDGWYRTGDLGTLDEEGFVRVVDRLKDMIISGGENIYPAEIESVLMGHPEISDAAVVGKPDDRWGEVPVAFVVKNKESVLNEAEIIEICRSNLAGFKCVKAVHFVDAVPRNTLGKVLKRSLRDQV